MPLIQNVGRKFGDKQIARKIVFPDAWDEKGQPIADESGKVKHIELLPSKHLQVTDEQFKHLRENFGNEILNIDDIKALQANVSQPSVRIEKPAGYMSPEEVEVAKQDAVKAAIAAHEASLKLNTDAVAKPETRSELAMRIDAMDRGDLVAFIEKEELPVEHKSVRIDTLKAAILEALDARTAEKTAE
jgi:hypothetical protein